MNAANLGRSPSPLRWYALEACNSVAAVFLNNGIFFYAHHLLGWSAQQNLLLAVGQGAVYIVTTLASHAVSRRLGPRNTLRLMWLLSALLAGLPLVCSGTGVLVPVVLGFTVVTGMLWPILESLVTAGTDPALMSRRVGYYNLTWAGCAGLAIVAVGWVIDHQPVGIFVVPALLGLAAAIGVGRTPLPHQKRPAGPSFLPHKEAPGKGDTSDAVNPHPALSLKGRGGCVGPDLQAIRTLALWLSRICIPATYVVFLSLLPMIPSLPAVAKLDTTGKTLLISVIYIVRWLTFLYLGHTVWWHIRPRLLLAAAAGLLLSFLGITIPASTWFGGPLGGALDLGVMALWQVVLGVSLGMIYASSLYFGMVLSDGSTQESGYHEALIGLGCTVGPGVAVLAGYVSSNPLAGIYGVAGVLLLSLLVAGAASLRLGRRIDTLRGTFAQDQPAERAVIFKNE